MGVTLNHLGILVTTYCNLNCRHCADLIPHRKNYHYPLEEIIDDLIKILSAVDSIEEVLIIGGETLMYPHVAEVLDFCKSQPEIKKIIFISNGKSMPGDNLLDCLEKNNAIVRMSGYQSHITPNREKALNLYKERGLSIEDMRDMSWIDIGDTSCKNRSEAELTETFTNCAMRECISLVRGGYLVFCSRQVSAMDTDLYPFPGKHEFVDVRSSSNLAKDIQKFLELPYISTCNYCNGITNHSTRMIPAGVQILPKATLLELIDYYCRWTKENDIAFLPKFVRVLLDNKESLDDIDEFPLFLNCFKRGINTPEDNESTINAATNLLNRLFDDYDFINSSNIPYYKNSPLYLSWQPKEKEDIPKDAFERIFNDNGLGLPSLRNVFFTEILGGPNKNADLYITDDELMDAVNEIYPYSGVNYSRLYLESKLKKVSEGGVRCIISGLSYTQEGIIESLMPVNSANLSTGGQDIPYSLLMAKKAINQSFDIETVIIPIAYYQGFYDMSTDDHPIHVDTVLHVNIPLLGDKRNFKGEIPNDKYKKNTGVLNIYEKISDLKKIRDQRDNELINILRDLDYYNHMLPRNPIGGLKFDFHELSTEEKFEKAIITEQHNRRILSYKSLETVLSSLEDWGEFTKDKNIRTVFFVPPFTRALSAAGEKCGKVKQIFYSAVVPEIKKIKGAEFLDLCDHPDFDDNDFCDFEHLNYSGAEKLTYLLGEKVLSLN